MRKIKRTTGIISVFMLLLVSFPACHDKSAPQSPSFRDIPGITKDEIRAIEALQKEYDSFVYGMTSTTEAFVDSSNHSGEVRGFSALFCEWMTSLFGISFKPVLYDWSDLIAGLESGEIDFTGDLMATGERRKMYFMTGPIAQRTLKYIRIADNPPLSKIVTERPLRLVFYDGSVAYNQTLASKVHDVFEPIFVENLESAYELLKNGKADAFLEEGVVESAFDIYPNITTEEFFPIIFCPVSLATHNAQFDPVISVMQKALQNAGSQYLIWLYNQGYREYLKNKLFMRMDEEEKAYLHSNPVVQFAAETDNYPVCFYNTQEKQWQGITIELLNEIQALTGLTFKIANAPGTKWPNLYRMLENGEVSFVTELLRTAERQERFLWPNTAVITDNYALLSKLEYRNINASEIFFTRIGLIRDSGHAGFFKGLFPNHEYCIEYDSLDACLDAIDRGEIDMVMASQNRLLILTHYRELPGYKANFLFDRPFNATFGFHKDEAVLCSIVDKALGLIDISGISGQWVRRTFDYRAKLMQAQRPPLIGASILFLCVLILVAVLLVRNIHAGRELEKLISKRTHDLALQTATLTTLLDSIPDLIFSKDLDMRFMQCNKSMLEHFKRRKEDVIGKNNEDGFGMPAEMAKEYGELDQKIIDEGQVVAFEERIPRFDGTNPLYETIKIPLMLDGVAIGILGISRDITRRKEMEKKLALRTATLTTLLDSIPDLVFTKNLDLHFMECNKSFLEHFGVSKESIVGKDDVDGIGVSVEMAEKYNEMDWKVIYERQLYMLEEHIPCIDGTNPLYETIKTPLILDGAVIGVLGISRDITKRKAMEEKIAFQTATITTLFDTIPDLIFSKDLNFCYTQCNKSFLEHLGVRKEDIIGKDDLNGLGLPRELVEEYREWDRKTVKEGRMVVFEECIPRFDGTNLLYETVKAPLILNGVITGVLGIAHDITSRKEMEAAALAASHSKTTFLANMSHEIRTPMNSIVGFSELALDADIPPKTRDYLSKILENAEWLLQIINDLLDISKIEAGRMELEHIPFDLHELFTTCRTIIMPKAIEKGIMLHFYAEPSVGKRLMGDPTRLRQVLINILSNAVKFTNSGTVKVFAEIIGKSEKPITGDETITMHFEIKDSGIGLTKEQIDKIFEPFMQAETGTTRKYGGTGLGLSITKNIIELMGGVLSVESMPGVGSKFSFDLTFDTIDVAVDDMFEQKLVFNEFEKPEFEGEVLLCEDNTMNQYVICEHLARVGLKTVVADNGKIGVDMVRERVMGKKKQFDMIFMDMHMPVMDGLEATVKILEMNVNVPIVAMTANIMSSDLETYRMSGLNDCVGKPFTSQELWRCLLKYLKPVNNKTLPMAGSLPAADNSQKNDPPQTKPPEVDLSKVNLPLTGGGLEADLNFQKIMQLAFVKGNQKKFAEIANALEAGDIKLAHRLAHTLKGNAGQVGKPQLQKAAADIEYQLKDGKNLASGQQLSLLETELDAALADITAELGELADELFH